jgi:hypothetical protein
VGQIHGESSTETSPQTANSAKNGILIKKDAIFLLFFLEKLSYIVFIFSVDPLADPGICDSPM